MKGKCLNTDRTMACFFTPLFQFNEKRKEQRMFDASNPKTPKHWKVAQFPAKGMAKYKWRLHDNNAKTVIKVG